MSWPGSTTLLATEMRTLWHLDANGRVRGYPAPLQLPCPLLIAASNAHGCISATTDDVVIEVAGRIDAMLDGERAQAVGVGAGPGSPDRCAAGTVGA